MLIISGPVELLILLCLRAYQTNVACCMFYCVAELFVSLGVVAVLLLNVTVLFCACVGLLLLSPYMAFCSVCTFYLWSHCLFSCSLKMYDWCCMREIIQILKALGCVYIWWVQMLLSAVFAVYG